MKMMHVLLLLVLASLALAAASANAADADKRARIQLRGIDPPAEGKFGRLGFEIRADWMDGFFQMRYPETLRTSLGLHFIDHNRRDMLPLSMLDPFPRWQLDEATGVLSYWHKTEDGVEFGGTVTPYEDEIHMEYRVKNGTDQRLDRSSPQMCLTVSGSADFNKKADLTDCRAWIDGKFTSLSETTPTPEQKGREPWVQVFTPALKGFTGRREHLNGWWVVDQFSDYGIIARVSRDGKHLVAIAWENAKGLMTNTRIPCLHAGPTGGKPIEPGEEVVWRGKIYLMANDPGDLLARYKRDSAAWTNLEPTARGGAW